MHVGNAQKRFILRTFLGRPRAIARVTVHASRYRFFLIIDDLTRWSLPHSMLLYISKNGSSSSMNARANGFTLVELMVTVSIVAILASIAVPAYNDYILRAKLPEAGTRLTAIHARMEQGYQNRKYYDAADCNTANGKNFKFECIIAGTKPQRFVARADGISGKGTEGFAYTISHDGNRNTVLVPSAVWGTPGLGCWITKKGGVC